MRLRSARNSRLDMRPPRRPRADLSRPPRDRLPPRADFLEPFEADRPPPCFFEAACNSNDVEPISMRTRRKLKSMNATLGERISFIGNSLLKKVKRRLPGRNDKTLLLDFCRSRGDAPIRHL